MKKTAFRLFSFLMAVLIVAGTAVPIIHATEEPVDPVQAVIQQLEAIDTLAQMQANRYKYTASGHYDYTTTDTARINKHLTARTNYETYVSEMFAARVAAQNAYDALTPDQQAQIDPALVAKLDNYLPNNFDYTTRSVTPRSDEYNFEAVYVGTGGGYEVSAHMVGTEIPQTFILVDTSDGATTWTPSGLYQPGVSNFEVAYCCDVETPMKSTTDYRRINLEDVDYFGEEAAQHIRGILLQSYPYVTMDQMKANLIAGGMDPDFVATLNRADIIAAVQLCIWLYANVELDTVQGYFTSISVPKNTGIYFTPIHDYQNELWEWFPGARTRSFDDRAQYRVNNLAYYLYYLPPVAAEEGSSLVTQVDITRADIVPNTDGSYKVGMYLNLNGDSKESDDLRITVTSYSGAEDGSSAVTSQISQPVAGRTSIQMTTKANPGDTIKVEVEGTQETEPNAYFYEAEGGRHVSQSLVSVSRGYTAVHALETFSFEEDIEEMGLRIYKTETDTSKPISDITFRIYDVNPAEGEALGKSPTEADIAKYATEENLVATLITDNTGYAGTELARGTYLVIEEHNAEKVKAPVAPFFVHIPMTKQVTDADGNTTTVVENIVSVYPKNEPVVPPPPPPPPPPDKVLGTFQIYKYDEVDENALEGAKFEVYKAATSSDTDTINITCNNMQYAVVPVLVDGQVLTLTTDAEGKAVSPELECGTYFLVEAEAPQGYNKLEQAVSVTVVANTLTTQVLVEIPNQRGNILPETGGFGTVLFILCGSILAIGAVIFIVTRRKMSTMTIDLSDPDDFLD